MWVEIGGYPGSREQGRGVERSKAKRLGTEGLAEKGQQQVAPHKWLVKEGKRVAKMDKLMRPDIGIGFYNWCFILDVVRPCTTLLRM